MRGMLPFSLLLLSLVLDPAVANTSNSEVQDGADSVSFMADLEDEGQDRFLQGDADPVWWESYRMQFGKRVKRCKNLSGIPADGSPCTRKAAGEYSCFWGEQTCPADGSIHPLVKCDCLDEGTWRCINPYLACEAPPQNQQPFGKCPDQHPLNFPYKITCETTVPPCNYGLQTCCGESFSTSTCECFGNQFKCFNHETCRYRTCSSACPAREPTPGQPCDQASPRETCAYGRVQCCGKDLMSRVHHCFNGVWDIVTDILVDCNCDTPPIPASVQLTEVASDFRQPVFLTHAGDDRRFVVERAGRVILLQPDGSKQTYLDIQDRVLSNGGERGLLSIAFFPGSGTQRRLFACYTKAGGAVVVSEFSASSASANPGSESVKLTVDQPLANHNGGQLQFGPDGFLYFGLGDGGGGGDPFKTGQDPTSQLGSMLRIDVSSSGSVSAPPDNPFVSSNIEGDPLVWAFGLRNPWRFSFDRVTGDLYIADVGQSSREEVNFHAAGAPGGQNYGWNAWEGTECFTDGVCQTISQTPPILEYGHSKGCSITGGYVYRGKESPSLQGLYFYGDFCRGTIWAAQRQSDDRWESQVMNESELSISSFGEDANGEVYVLDYGSGDVYKIKE